MRGRELSHDCAASVERSCCNQYGQSVRGVSNWDMAIHQIANIIDYEGPSFNVPVLRSRLASALLLVHWTYQSLGLLLTKAQLFFISYPLNTFLSVVIMFVLPFRNNLPLTHPHPQPLSPTLPFLMLLSNLHLLPSRGFSPLIWETDGAVSSSTYSWTERNRALSMSRWKGVPAPTYRERIHTLKLFQ